VNSPESSDIEILYENGAVFVLNKPSGLLTQAPPGIDSLEWRFKDFIKKRLNSAGNIYVGVPHRLDRPVSGAIILVRNIRAAQRISAQLEARTVKKFYWAIVERAIAQDEATWIDWMRKLPDEARSEIVAPEHPDAKQAVLYFRVLARSESRTLVEIELKTGRTHQIRLQFSQRGFPIVGDTLYGASTTFGEPSSDPRKQSIALHAKRLSFEHPIELSAVDVVAPLSPGWRA
jgi:23S rRNA pseudouridine1911/1915/1917 synthase